MPFSLHEWALHPAGASVLQTAFRQVEITFDLWCVVVGCCFFFVCSCCFLHASPLSFCVGGYDSLHMTHSSLSPAFGSSISPGMQTLKLYITHISISWLHTQCSSWDRWKCKIASRRSSVVWIATVYSDFICGESFKHKSKLDFWKQLKYFFFFLTLWRFVSFFFLSWAE